MQENSIISDSNYVEQAKKNDATLPSEEAAALLKNEAAAARGYFWFIAQGNLLKGPYSTTELKKLIDKKEISEKFFAWRDGYREWRPLYGIEELKAEKVTGEPMSYPSVPIPGNHASTANTDGNIRQRNAPIYKVRFNRSRWSDLKKSEVVGLFLVSLGFTLCFLFLSFNVFEKEWDKVWGRRSSSMIYNLGTTTNTIPLYMLGPLQAAPGLKYQEETWIPVEMEGNMDHYRSSELNGIKINTNLPEAALQNLKWDDSHTYTRRMKVRGYLNLKNPAMIEVEEKGLPYEPPTSERLSKGSSHP